MLIWILWLYVAPMVFCFMYHYYIGAVGDISLINMEDEDNPKSINIMILYIVPILNIVLCSIYVISMISYQSYDDDE